MKLATLILCGGFGSRLGNLTKFTPKPLIKIGKITFLEILIKNLILKGLNIFYLSTFFKSYKFNNIQNCKILREPNKLGSGGAIIFSLKKIKKKNVLVLNGDTISNMNLRRFINSHEKYSKIISVLTVKKKSEGRYGGFFKKKKKISFEKNKKLLQVDSGAYIINRNRFNKIFRFKSACEVSDIIKILLSINEVNLYNQKDLKFIDIGTKKDLYKFIKKFKMKY
jgi:NDP-sugar pyrophosphorylase family protein